MTDIREIQPINKCITCQTNEVNPQIGNNFCSRTCLNLWTREDLKYLDLDTMRSLALLRLAAIKSYSSLIELE